MRALLAMLLMISAAHAAAPPLCMDEEMRERMRDILLTAIEKGLEQHAVHVFQTWTRDKIQQPERAIAGLRVGLEAFIRSRQAILAWNPPPCVERKLQ